jgi:AP-3 complex subunit mu
VLKVSFAEGLTAERLRNNFSSIELMLDAMLDYGYPLITQKFVLESIIKPSGVIEKIEESLLGRHNMHKDQFQVLDKFVEQCADVRDHSQYRITDIRGDEEVFFDVIEYLDCVIDKYRSLRV